MNTYFTFENLYKAYRQCRKRKAKTYYHLLFAENLEENLFALEKELINRSYRPGRSIAFVVQKPKIREIFAADFRDRVVHHLLYNYLAPIFERCFIYDSYACRKNKGTHRAVQKLTHFVHELERERGFSPLPLCLKMDIKSFFTSIDQIILYGLICKKVKNEEILWLAQTIIFHDSARSVKPVIQSRPELFARLPVDKSLFLVEKGKGLPIGNLTSQFFANVYLNELDCFVKHTLKVKYYIRYVDDFLILGNNEHELNQYRRRICVFVTSRLRLSMHPEKQTITPLKNGIDFLGYYVKPEYVLVRNRVVGNWRYALSETSNVKKVKVINNSYTAHCKWANARTLVDKMIMPFDP
ncbi:MAG TPA: reverse transcriptase/maturase family protein [bacterium]|nr:reverse transcriptase/maturase family protein [bacterium]